MTPGTWSWYVERSKSQSMSAEWIARRPGLSDLVCLSLAEAEEATDGIIGATIEPRVLHLSSVGGEA